MSDSRSTIYLTGQWPVQIQDSEWTCLSQFTSAKFSDYRASMIVRASTDGLRYLVYGRIGEGESIWTPEATSMSGYLCLEGEVPERIVRVACELKHIASRWFSYRAAAEAEIDDLVWQVTARLPPTTI